jgi:hypothetical protein
MMSSLSVVHNGETLIPPSLVRDAETGDAAISNRPQEVFIVNRMNGRIPTAVRLETRTGKVSVPVGDGHRRRARCSSACVARTASRARKSSIAAMRATLSRAASSQARASACAFNAAHFYFGISHFFFRRWAEAF